MTVTEIEKENQDEENGPNYKESNSLNGHVEDVYKMTNNLNGQKKVEVNFKMKIEEDEELFIPLKMTVTKTGKENQEEENGPNYKEFNSLNGHVEDVYQMTNNLNGQKKVEVNFKMKIEEDVDEKDTFIPLKIITKKDNFITLSKTDENDELTDMVANLNITKAEPDNEDEDEVEENTRRDTDDDEEKLVHYIIRGPIMGGRFLNNRIDPYERNTNTSPPSSSATSPPSSSPSSFDSESSNSSPDTSPRHSISFMISSRPHYDSVGLVTVLPPDELNRGAEGESPTVDHLGRKRHSLKHLSGGGLVLPDEQPSSSSASSPSSHSNFPNLQYPLLTVSDSSSIPVDPTLDQSRFIRTDSLALPVPSPYATYRDTLSHSPLSVQSHSDESIALASPASDFSQPSPLSHEYQEPFHCSDIDISPSSSQQPFLFLRGASVAVNKPRVGLQLEPQPFLGDNIEDLVSDLLGGFEGPDKNTDFAGITLCDTIDPVIASLSSSASHPYPAQSEFQTLVTSLPPPPPPLHPPQQRRVQRSPPLDQNISSNPRSRRNSKQDIQEEVNKIMKSYPPILPKLDPPSTSSALKPQTNPSPPLLLPPPQPPKFGDAVGKMRSLFSDHERNVAIVQMEKLTIEQHCSGDRKDGDTYLHIAVGERNYAIVYAIVTLLDEKNRSVDINNSLRQTPLFVAVAGNNPTIVEYLLRYKANPDCICRDGMTPLLFVASRGDAAYDVAKILCDTECVNFKRRNSQGLTALHLAVQTHGHVNSIRIIKLFLQKGASLIEGDSRNGKTALHLAVERGCVDMVRTLCGNGSNVPLGVNAETYVGDTPLHLAAVSRNIDEKEQLELIKILLNHGANPGLRNKDRKLPRDLVASNRNTVVQSLDLKCNCYKSHGF